MAKSGIPEYAVGFVLFEGYEILDLMGPLEIVGNVELVVGKEFAPKLYLVAETLELVKDHLGFQFKPTMTFDRCPPLDILVVPGGQVRNVLDPAIAPNSACLQFVKERAPQAKYLVSICTGALILAAADLLKGQIATTHWASMPLLNLFPEVMVAGGYPSYTISRKDRVYAEPRVGAAEGQKGAGNLITSSGVISGVDAALALVAVVYGNQVARQIQLLIQYHPEPPFESGTPEVADPKTVANVCVALDEVISNRYRIIKELLQ